MRLQLLMYRCEWLRNKDSHASALFNACALFSALTRRFGRWNRVFAKPHFQSSTGQVQVVRSGS